MPTPPRSNPGSAVEISTTTNPAPAPQPTARLFNRSLRATNEVLATTSLNANAGAPAQLANLNYANSVSNTNRGAQNAVANQQAHAQLALTITGKTTGKVSAPGATVARASVDVLTDNALADEIAGLSAAVQAFPSDHGLPGPGPSGRRQRIATDFLSQLFKVLLGNQRVQGSGTLSDPYTLKEGPLFVRAPITLGFPKANAGNIKFTPATDPNGPGVQISS